MSLRVRGGSGLTRRGSARQGRSDSEAADDPTPPYRLPPVSGGAVRRGDALMVIRQLLWLCKNCTKNVVLGGQFRLRILERLR